MQSALIAVGVAGIALVLLKLKHILVDEDRPEIVVRNGILRIKTRKLWKRWSSSDKEWNPDHPNGKSVKKYEVTVTNAESCTNTPLTGDEVHLVFETSGPNPQRHEIKLDAKRRYPWSPWSKRQPVIEASLDLQWDGTDHEVLKPVPDLAGGIKKVSVGGQECTFPKVSGDEVVVKVDIKH